MQNLITTWAETNTRNKCHSSTENTNQGKHCHKLRERKGGGRKGAGATLDIKQIELPGRPGQTHALIIGYPSCTPVREGEPGGLQMTPADGTGKQLTPRSWTGSREVQAQGSLARKGPRGFPRACWKEEENSIQTGQCNPQLLGISDFLQLLFCWSPRGYLQREANLPSQRHVLQPFLEEGRLGGRRDVRQL